jgi:hypothetical protein
MGAGHPQAHHGGSFGASRGYGGAIQPRLPAHTACFNRNATTSSDGDRAECRPSECRHGAGQCCPRAITAASARQRHLRKRNAEAVPIVHCQQSNSSGESFTTLPSATGRRPLGSLSCSRATTKAGFAFVGPTPAALEPINADGEGMMQLSGPHSKASTGANTSSRTTVGEPTHGAPAVAGRDVDPGSVSFPGS